MTNVLNGRQPLRSSGANRVAAPMRRTLGQLPKSDAHDGGKLQNPQHVDLHFLSRPGGRFDRRRRDGNLSVLSQWASEYGPKNGMKVNYQVLGSGAGIEQETIKISERQSGVVA